MRIVCEVIATEVLPALRARIAKYLIETYGITQKEAARKMGLTQPAISQYKKQMRGRKLKLINDLGLDKTAMRVAKGLYEGMDMEEANTIILSSCSEAKKKLKGYAVCGIC